MADKIVLTQQDLQHVEIFPKITGIDLLQIFDDVQNKRLIVNCLLHGETDIVRRFTIYDGQDYNGTWVRDDIMLALKNALNAT